ncbi:MAG: four helix bundle protein [Kiritimatiellae bacterium]|jgi:four helix bundle protein|nr:four helix bundle protein [Kiritimatiellia bacterium]
MSGESVHKDLKQRLREYALRIIRMYAALPKNDKVAQVLGGQVLRSGTLVGAQYAEGTRARSDAEFISKLESALQELEETDYWLCLIVESNLMPKEKLTSLIEETHELNAIFTSSIMTVKKRINSKRR